jgi:serine/threonine-protein kinase
MIGELIGHYRVLELIGRGAMGVVYRGLDVNLDRPVAIKVMSVEARNDPDFVERFRQEARLQGALNHPNVALLFDYFVHDGAPVAVMELIAGESLEELIRRRGAIPAREAVSIFKQALRGVAAAHRAGIVHRDLKPSNLMVTGDGSVKVMDFGIARRQGVTGATKASTSIGSPLYMAPEQILGRAVDCRTDVYALGVTFYELLSGQRPFNTRGKAEYLVLDAHVNDTPEPPTVYRYGIPQPIVSAVMRALAKDPDARFQSADEFMQALPDGPAASEAVATPPDPASAAAPQRVGPTGTEQIPQPPFTDTVTLDYSPPEHAPTKRIDPPGSMAFDFTASTVLRQLDPAPSAASLAATVPTPVGAHPGAAPPGALQRTRAHAMGIVAVLVATVALGTLIRYAGRLHPTPVSPAAQAPASTDAAAPAPAPPIPGVDTRAAQPSDATAAANLPAAAEPAAALPSGSTPSSAAPRPAQPDLSGTWQGAYFDGSGRQLLRVVSLSIHRVHDDGGIEGTLQYEAPSGEGECQLHPRGSSYSAGRQRLQLSPESCSPHYPRELGVPLDFEGVRPQAGTLRNGRIEAPSGESIRVRLKRVT